MILKGIFVNSITPMHAGMFPLLSVCEAKPAIKIPTKIYGHLQIPKSWRVQLQLWSTELSLNNLAQQAP